MYKYIYTFIYQQTRIASNPTSLHLLIAPPLHEICSVHIRMHVHKYLYTYMYDFSYKFVPTYIYKQARVASGPVSLAHSIRASAPYDQ